MDKSVAVLALAMVAACSSGGRPKAQASFVDDARSGQGIGLFQYTGRWEHLSGHNDGRFFGTSTRSRYAGDDIILPFDGTAVRVFGVRGPNGGSATVAIDGRYYGSAEFFAPHIETHALIFASPTLKDGTHTLGLVVRGDARVPHRLYVNLDGVEILHDR